MPGVDDFRNPATHPYNIMMYLLLAGLTMIFVGLSAAYLYTRFQNGTPPLQLPWLFMANTVVLLASSGTMLQARKSYLADQTKRYQQWLLLTLGLSFLFIGLQFVAFQQMYNARRGLESGPMNAYIIAISVIHAVHILGGVPFLAVFYVTAIRRMKDPISVLVYFTDPLKKMRLDLLCRYWHFLDILWVYLVLFFTINAFIK
jgi:cytochrome c oxidase subunit 3